MPTLLRHSLQFTLSTGIPAASLTDEEDGDHYWKNQEIFCVIKIKVLAPREA